MVSKRMFSPATELLRSNGFTTSEIARSSHRHVNAVSQLLNGRVPWTEWFERSLIEVTKDLALVEELRTLQAESRRQCLKRQLAELDAS